MSTTNCRNYKVKLNQSKKNVPLRQVGRLVDYV